MLRRTICNVLEALPSRLCARLTYATPAAAASVPILPSFDHLPQTYTGPSAKNVAKLRSSHIPQAVFTFYKNPLMLVEGKMQYVYDDTGRRYLDAIGGIVTISVGHCQPDVLKAVQRQQELLGHVSTLYLHPEFALYAKELTSKLPPSIDQVFLVNSGSEANDLALLLARCYTGNYDLITLRNAYHGGGQATMGLTGMGNWKHPVPQGFGIHRVAVPNAYRGIFGDDIQRYIEEIEEVIATATSGGIAGFFCEPIQGAGGCVTLLEGYLKKAYAVIRKSGGICIADEVQTAFGRTGKNFWGFQNHDVVPDIVTLAKGIANGMPLAAVATRKEIADSLLGKLYFNTFGATPPIVAGARMVLRIIEEQGLQQNAAKVGGIILSGLEELQNKHDIVGNVRGSGLMIGVEFVSDRATKSPATKETIQIMENLRDIGLLVGKGGIQGNVIRIKPPMCLTDEDGHFVVDACSYALSRL